MTAQGSAARFPPSCCQVTSSPRDQFSRYSKWLDTFRTALVWRNAGIAPLINIGIRTELSASHPPALPLGKCARYAMGRPQSRSRPFGEENCFQRLWNHILCVVHSVAQSPCQLSYPRCLLKKAEN